MVLLYVATVPMLQIMKRRMPWFQVGMMKNLYWFHTLFTVIYYIFQLYSRSDSQDYYLRPQTNYATWFSAYDTGTPFIDFVGYPFINYLGFTFEMMFALFAFGYLFGFVGVLIAVPVAAAIGVLMRFALRQYYASPFYAPVAAAAPQEIDGGEIPVARHQSRGELTEFP